jgi:hypothetical protein
MLLFFQSDSQIYLIGQPAGNKGTAADTIILLLDIFPLYLSNRAFFPFLKVLGRDCPFKEKEHHHAVRCQ